MRAYRCGNSRTCRSSGSCLSLVSKGCGVVLKECDGKIAEGCGDPLLGPFRAGGPATQNWHLLRRPYTETNAFVRRVCVPRVSRSGAPRACSKTRSADLGKRNIDSPGVWGNETFGPPTSRFQKRHLGEPSSSEPSIALNWLIIINAHFLFTSFHISFAFHLFMSVHFLLSS